MDVQAVISEGRGVPMDVYRGKKRWPRQTTGRRISNRYTYKQIKQTFLLSLFYVISLAPYSSVFLHFKISSLSPILSPLSLFLSLSLSLCLKCTDTELSPSLSCTNISQFHINYSSERFSGDSLVIIITRI